jgi:hypothetical protein
MGPVIVVNAGGWVTNETALGIVCLIVFGLLFTLCLCSNADDD